jgi:hypothetical protein
MDGLIQSDPDSHVSANQGDEPVGIENLDSNDVEQIEWDSGKKVLMRQILTQKVDLPISRLGQMIDDKEIDLVPGFQRRLRWSRAQQSRLIESIIMNVPIPPVFLGEDEPGQYVVLDGRQRLTALHEFINMKYKLSGLEVWSELNKKNFKQLKEIRGQGEPPVATAITRRFIPAVVILQESAPEVKYEVFDRLNTGGVVAEPMEVRNAIYRGRFNKVLRLMSQQESFCLIWGIPIDERKKQKNPAYKKMVDLEMALRFLAFQDYEKFSGSIKTFLNEFMAHRNDDYRDNPGIESEDWSKFEATMNRTLNLLGPLALHRPTSETERSPVPSAPFADAVLYAMSKLPHGADSQELGNKINRALVTLCTTDDEFVKSITVGTNAKTSAKYRIETANNVVLSQI